jgi:TetR/AcrR family transcriptional regulator, cholesterol catabolism regulator
MAQARATTTEHVTAAAARVFLKKGYQASTIEDIAREAGISKPTVYQYAKSKQWLLDRIVSLVLQEMEQCESVLLSAQAPANVRLYWIFQLHVAFAVRYRKSYEVTLSEQAGLSSEAQDEFRLWARRATSNFADLLADCRREGSFDWPQDVDVAASLIMSTLNSIHRWFHPGEALSSTMLVDHVANLFSGVYTAPDMTRWPMPELPVSVIDLGQPDVALTAR